jgi:hypothetical protein
MLDSREYYDDDNNNPNKKTPQPECKSVEIRIVIELGSPNCQQFPG